MIKAFIKDCTNINGETKALFSLKKGTIKEDRMTTANSSFEALEVPNNVNINDILVLVNEYGKTLYRGVISSIKDNKITTKQIQNIYNGKFIYSIVDELRTSSPSTYLEEEIGKVVGHFSEGKLYGSTFIDNLISQKLSSISIETGDSISRLLESDKDEDGNENYTQLDMINWIYSLYDKYGIVFDFEIPPQDGLSKVKIWKPNYTGLKISDGYENINNISPTTEVQTINKLVIYAQDKTYRSTYILTENGIIEEPSSIEGRLNQINTTIVFSDDDIEDIISANLNNNLFNHKIEFNVDLNSKIFNYDDLKLDMPIEIYNGKDYYNTIITGREFSFNESGSISDLKIIGGKIRNSLTQKITLGLIK